MYMMYGNLNGDQRAMSKKWYKEDMCITASGEICKMTALHSFPSFNE